jgi:transcription initiation factor TFIIIB Brf1 subunit/transcription initiation factor TFIIB
MKEKIPAVIKRCPKCHKLTLEFDPETGRIYCTSCGFKEHIKVVK